MTDTVVQCIHETPGLTRGATYTVQGRELCQTTKQPMVRVHDGNGYFGLYWAWRFKPGPDMPPSGNFRFG